MEIFFLGSGGGRIVLDSQLLATGGFRINSQKLKMHVDPGPGALIKSVENKQFPSKLDAVFASHAHVDHCNDAAVMAEAMNFGSFHKQRGFLLGSKSVLEGCGEFEKEVPEYFKKMVAKWKSLKPGEKFNFGKEHDNASLTATKTVHEDKSGIGFVFHAEEEKVGYTGDTEDFNGLWGQYENCTVLVVNCLRPFRDKFPFHLSADEVADGVNSLIKRPAKIVLTHLGLKFIKAGQKQQQNRLEKATGTPTIIARERVVVKVKREKQQAL